MAASGVYTGREMAKTVDDLTDERVDSDLVNILACLTDEQRRLLLKIAYVGPQNCWPPRDWRAALDGE